MEAKDLACRQVLLAPHSAKAIPSTFQDIQEQPALYDQLLGDMQRLRGRVYLGDEAIRPQDLTADGRHYTPIDELSWHLLTLDNHGQIAGCARLYAHCTVLLSTNC